MFFSSWIPCARMISALIVLVTLASVPTAVEAQSKQRCGNMYFDRGNGGETNIADCTNDGNVAYKCDLDSCHGGEGAGNPRTHPMSNFAFVKCSDADLNGNPISNPDKRVYVYNFEFNRATNRLDVLGYTKPTKSNVTPAHFNCDRNTVRPWCDRCYRA
ncbi:hypothetical protein PCASD_23000 [Puccinia coronata f. sp. avenae]|uniref:Cyanovirin-N domain-containing protein n=1 Tax=Puccinia coronata f. sp. avenae TaxID=200324 RepID=A0A2N5TQB1_9BASI|nr:hypothetical protein PCASD_25780 [Puccinia coronata f. sp. avenae]PLW27685.1 hypothetical protein PCASD_23000 [Puccinia coronata f. sp. avenae]